MKLNTKKTKGEKMRFAKYQRAKMQLARLLKIPNYLRCRKCKATEGSYPVDKNCKHLIEVVFNL